MDSTAYISSIENWLKADRSFEQLPVDRGLLPEPVLPGEYLYSYQGGNGLVLVKLVDAGGMLQGDLVSNLQAEFNNLQVLRNRNNLPFATQIVIYVFSHVSEPSENITKTKHVSAVSRCNLVSWVVDLSGGMLHTHKGMPLSTFGLLKEGSPLLSPQAAKLYTEKVEALPQVEKPHTNARRPWVTYFFIALCTLVSISNGFSTDMFVLTRYGAKVNDLVAAGEYWRLLTSVFLHYGVLHFAFNMLFLYNLGPVLETFFGPWRFSFIYLTAGLFGSLASFMFTQGISMGASGALFGIIGAYLYWWIKNPKLGKRIGPNIIALLVVNIIYGRLNPSIDNWAHFGGLLGGFLAAVTVGVPEEKLSNAKRVVTAVVLGVTVFLGVKLGIQFEASPERVAFATGRQINEVSYLLDKKDYSGAQNSIAKVLAKEPDNYLARYYLGFTYFSQGNYEAAIEEFQLVVNTKPDLAEGQFLLGYSLAKTGNKEKAILHLSKAVRLRPNDTSFKTTLDKVQNNQAL